MQAHPIQAAAQQAVRHSQDAQGPPNRALIHSLIGSIDIGSRRPNVLETPGLLEGLGLLILAFQALLEGRSRTQAPIVRRQNQLPIVRLGDRLSNHAQSTFSAQQQSASSGIQVVSSFEGILGSLHRIQHKAKALTTLAALRAKPTLDKDKDDMGYSITLPYRPVDGMYDPKFRMTFEQFIHFGESLRIDTAPNVVYFHKTNPTEFEKFTSLKMSSDHSETVSSYLIEIMEESVLSLDDEVRESLVNITQVLVQSNQMGEIYKKIVGHYHTILRKFIRSLHSQHRANYSDSSALELALENQENSGLLNALKGKKTSTMSQLIGLHESFHLYQNQAHTLQNSLNEFEKLNKTLEKVELFSENAQWVLDYLEPAVGKSGTQSVLRDLNNLSEHRELAKKELVALENSLETQAKPLPTQNPLADLSKALETSTTQVV